MGEIGIPYGVSQLEHEGAKYTESEQDGATIRTLVMPEQAKEVMFKREGSWGFVYVDGLVLSEYKYPEDSYWSRGGFRITQARKIAKALGATFVDF